MGSNISSDSIVITRREEPNSCQKEGISHCDATKEIFKKREKNTRI